MQRHVLAGIFVATAGVVFALQNQMRVSVTFLLWTLDSSLALVLLFALALGALAMFLAAVPERFRARRQQTRQRNELQQCEAARQALEAQVKTLESRLASLPSSDSVTPAAAGSRPALPRAEA